MHDKGLEYQTMRSQVFIFEEKDSDDKDVKNWEI